MSTQPSQLVEPPANAVRAAAVGEAEASLSWPALWAVIFILGATGAYIAQRAHGAGPGLFISTTCLMICLIAAGYDAATSRIPNQLTYTAILAGFLLNSLPGMFKLLGFPGATQWIGAAGPSQSLLGFGLCAGIGLLCLFLAGMGGGDLKLLAAIGALLGSHQASLVMICALVVAVPYAILNLLALGKLNRILRRRLKSPLPRLSEATPRRPGRFKIHHPAGRPIAPRIAPLPHPAGRTYPWLVRDKELLWRRIRFNIRLLRGSTASTPPPSSRPFTATKALPPSLSCSPSPSSSPSSASLSSIPC